MFGRAAITLGIGPHSSLFFQLSKAQCNKCASKTHIPPYGALIRLVFRLLEEPPLGQSSPKWEKLLPDSSRTRM